MSTALGIGVAAIGLVSLAGGVACADDDEPSIVSVEDTLSHVLLAEGRLAGEYFSLEDDRRRDRIALDERGESGVLREELFKRVQLAGVDGDAQTSWEVGVSGSVLELEYDTRLVAGADTSDADMIYELELEGRVDHVLSFDLPCLSRVRVVVDNGSDEGVHAEVGVFGPGFHFGFDSFDGEPHALLDAPATPGGFEVFVRYEAVAAAGRENEGQASADASLRVLISVDEVPGCNLADVVAPFGRLDYQDVTAFMQAFAAGDSAADIAPPFGVIDFNDARAFQIAVGRGCP